MPPSLRLARPALLGAAALLLAACHRGPAGGSLRPLCASTPLVATVVLHVDSVRAAAGAALAALRGDSARVELSFGVLEEPAPCVGRGGVVTVAGALPPALATATEPSGSGRWRVAQEGAAEPEVLVDLNPRARDNNLTLRLPLEGGTGSWSLSTFAGLVGSGRATVARAERPGAR